MNFNERIFKCPCCSHFREEMALYYCRTCPVHGVTLQLVGTLRDLYRPDLLAEKPEPRHHARARL